MRAFSMNNSESFPVIKEGKCTCEMNLLLVSVERIYDIPTTDKVILTCKRIAIYRCQNCDKLYYEFSEGEWLNPL